MLTQKQFIDRMNHYGDPRVIAEMSKPGFELVKDGCIDTEQLQNLIDIWDDIGEILLKDSVLRSAVMKWGILKDEDTCDFIHWNIPHYEKKMTLLYIMVKFPCTFNQSSIDMVATTDGADIEWPQIPVSGKWKICPTCEGEGTYVNPSIDAGGISMDEFGKWSAEEQERYFSGFYDVTCSSCSGEGKVRAYEFGKTIFSDWAFKKYNAYLAECARCAEERAWEKRMGC